MDKELEVMSNCLSQLSGVDKEAQNRVIEWLIKKLDLSSTNLSSNFDDIPKDNTTESEVGEVNDSNKQISDFKTIHDLFANLEAKSDSDKALVVASFLQIKNGLTDMSSREINSELKHMGHGVGNITNALSALKNKKPQLIIQTRKSGTSKQAQKKYKVTPAGIKVVNEALHGGKINN